MHHLAVKWRTPCPSRGASAGVLHSNQGGEPLALSILQLKKHYLNSFLIGEYRTFFFPKHSEPVGFGSHWLIPTRRCLSLMFVH